MTLQELTDKLQLFAHHGHAQDKVVIESNNVTPENVEIRPLGCGQIIIDFLGGEND